MGLIDTFKEAFAGGKKAPDIKPGRNDPCWCGSGKKYKRCHLEADERKRSAKLAAASCRGST